MLFFYLEYCKFYQQLLVLYKYPDDDNNKKETFLSINNINVYVITGD